MDLAFIQKKWINNMAKDTTASIQAWDSVANDYIYDDTTRLESDPFLLFLQEKIQLTKQMQVLDVGCGAGAYCVALSNKVGHVTGTDFSPEMLKVGQRYVEANSIKNVDFLERNWWECSGDEFYKKYDLVFAHTTPAIADYSTLLKMMKASTHYCAICKPARRTDEVSDAIRTLAGCSTEKSDDSIAYAFDTIWGHGYTPEIAYHETVWKSQKSIAEAIVWYLNRLKGSCHIDAYAEQKIIDYLKDISIDGVVNETIRTTLVSMIWEV